MWIFPSWASVFKYWIPQLVDLTWNVVDPLGSGALTEGVTGRRPWSLVVWLHFLSVLHLLMGHLMWPATQLLPCLPTMMDCTLKLEAQIISSSLKLLLANYLVRATRKVTLSPKLAILNDLFFVARYNLPLKLDMCRAGGSLCWGRPGVHRESLSKKKN